MPDARKTLAELRQEWVSCRRCSLGLQRESNGGEFVFGQGTRRTIMFIGEGPGVEEDETGTPFIGKSGQLLRSIVHKLGIGEHYISNLVTCRSCEPVLDDHGLPRMRRRQRGPSVPMYRDTPPLPVQWKTCLPRLHEEIYLVDPIVIVSLGGTAAEALTGHAVTITRDRGSEVHIEIPGAGFNALLTEKKQVWVRKVHGQMSAPVEPSKVRYTLIPTLHPAYVLRKIADQGHNSPFRQIVDDIRKAAKIYELYMQEVHHRSPSGYSDTTCDEVSSSYLSGESNE